MLSFICYKSELPYDIVSLKHLKITKLPKGRLIWLCCLTLIQSFRSSKQIILSYSHKVWSIQIIKGQSLMIAFLDSRDFSH